MHENGPCGTRQLYQPDDVPLFELAVEPDEFNVVRRALFPYLIKEKRVFEYEYPFFELVCGQGRLHRIFCCREVPLVETRRSKGVPTEPNFRH